MNPDAQIPVGAPVGDEDAAWVVVHTPWPLPWLRAFCRDVERLYRINPYLEFGQWRALGPGRWQAQWRNLSNGRELDLGIEAVWEGPDTLVLHYSEGLKRLTRVSLAATPPGSTLTLTDDYSRHPAAERVRRLAEVDHSLRVWGQALHEYLRLERRWGWLPLWGWYRRRMWLPMKPMARRITWMLIVVDGVFILALLLMALSYALERLLYGP